MEDNDKMNEIIEDLQQESQIEPEALTHWDDYNTQSLVDIFKRVLYPILNSVETSSVSPLIRLCCQEVTRNWEFLKQQYTSLPVNRYNMLLKTAFQNDIHQSIAILMSTWPFTSLSIEQMIPVTFDDWKVLVDRESTLKFLSHITEKYLRCLILFLDAIKLDSKSRLRVLDLRGMPMSDRVMNYIIREITIISATVSLSDTYHIIVDCAICTNDTFDRLSSLFKSTQDSPKINLQLHINKLDLSRLSPAKNWELLQQMNTNELVGLCVRIDIETDYYGSLHARFHNLTSLEIVNHDWNRGTPPDQHPTFQFNSQLCRLAFRFRRYPINNTLPNSLVDQLEYLDISDDFIFVPGDSELQHLSSVPFRLFELNLYGYLIVDRHINLWTTLMSSLAPTLKILEWEFCLITSSDFLLLLPFILPLVNLRYLNFSNCKVRMRTLSTQAVKLGSMPKLHCVRLPYIDESLIEHYTPDETPAITWREEIEQKFTIEKSHPTEIIWVPFTPDYISD